MHGLMQHHPLRIIDILTYAAEAFPDEGIVSVREEGDVHRITYPDVLSRVSQLAHALQRLGVGIGDRVATLAWNGYRHFELYYGVSGIGAVCHTINPRLSQEQLCFIITHAEDKVICVDPSLLPVLETAKAQLPQDIVFIVLTDPAHMPDTSLDVLSYDELLAAEPPTFDWPVFPEEPAAAVLYLRDHWQSQRGAILTSLYGAARADGGRGPSAKPVQRQVGSAGRPALSRQCLGHALYRATCGHDDGHARIKA